MTTNPKVSIIIPAYNVSKYIGQCVSSILNQSYTNIEVIVVDDGSTDNTMNILNDIRIKDDRLIVIHQSNGGVSMARNTGINASTGDLITFCDSDDYIDRDHISKLLDLLVKNKDCQLAITSDYNLFEPSGRISASACDDGCYESKEIIDRLLNHRNDNLLAAVWNKLFIGTIIKDNKICFDINLRYGEDWLFVINYLRHISNVAMSNTPTYYYRRYEGERLSTTFNENGYLMAIAVRKTLSKWFPDVCDNENYNRIVIKIAYNNLSQYARKRGLKRFVGFSKKIFNNLDIIEACKSLDNNSNVVFVRKINSRRYNIFLAWCYVNFSAQFARYYICHILGR